MVLSDVEFRTGWNYSRAKLDFEEGVKHLEKARDLNPNNEEIRVKLGVILYREFNKLKESIIELRAALAIDHNNVEALMYLGKILLKD